MADIVGMLIAERDRIDRAIAILQGTEPRRGRPAGTSMARATARTTKEGGEAWPTQHVTSGKKGHLRADEEVLG